MPWEFGFPLNIEMSYFSSDRIVIVAKEFYHLPETCFLSLLVYQKEICENNDKSAIPHLFNGPEV